MGYCSLGHGTEIMLAISGTIIILFYILFRVKSLETAVKLLESTDIQIRLISDQLKLISQKPLSIRNFAVADARNLHEDLKVQINCHVCRHLYI